MFTIDGYKVYFKHRPEETTVDYRGNTECVIEKDGEFFCKGEAFCSWEDNFDKAKGRKVSLGRALVNGNFTKEERATFWECYKLVVRRI